MKRLNKRDYEEMFAFLDKVKKRKDNINGGMPYSYENYLVSEFPDIFDESDTESINCPRRILNIVKKWREEREK